MDLRSIEFRALGGAFEHDDVAAATSVLEAATRPTGSFFPLSEETRFQAAFAAHEGARNAVAVNSCGTALDLCMMTLGIGPGEEVITTPLTFICTATCAAARGAKVVFADINSATMCLDPDAVRKKINSRTRAIIPVHFAGLAADIGAFDEISRTTGIPVIYDAAHAVGALYRGERIGGRGKASCYSFQSNKNMTTLGEGGAVTTDDGEFAEQVRRRKTFGYVYGPNLRAVCVGFNYRMTKPQLAVGMTQLAKARRVNGQKLAAMRQLHDLLSEVSELILPAGVADGHGAHLYVVRLDSTRVAFSRDDLRGHLKSRYHVNTALHYPAVWSWETFQQLDYDKSNCPNAERACAEVISLPVFAQSSLDDIHYIAWAVKRSMVELCG